MAESKTREHTITTSQPNTIGLWPDTPHTAEFDICVEGDGRVRLHIREDIGEHYSRLAEIILTKAQAAEMVAFLAGKEWC